MSAPTLKINGTLQGYSTDLKPRFKELVTSSQRLSARRTDLKSAVKAAKMGHGRKK
jgi:hypothetical protein